MCVEAHGKSPVKKLLEPRLLVLPWHTGQRKRLSIICCILSDTDKAKTVYNTLTRTSTIWWWWSSNHPPPAADYLSGCVGDARWSPSLYPDLYTPTSPSWSLHWTYRDSQLVNLPVSLLVEGDVIALRPGQEAFAALRGIKVRLWRVTWH